MNEEAVPLRGRQAEARRNDGRILEAALDVLAGDPGAPMSAIARRAGVGQASLYRRYPARATLLEAVAEQGMTSIGDAARRALETPDAAAAVADFLGWYVDSGTLRLSSLLGAFSPPQRLFALARETNRALDALVARGVAAGALRPDVTGADLTLVAGQISTVEGDGEQRTLELRRRYLGLALQALTLAAAPRLPGPAPDADELVAPWRRSVG